MVFENSDDSVVKWWMGLAIERERVLGDFFWCILEGFRIKFLCDIIYNY